MGTGMRNALRGLGVCGGAFLLFAALALWHPPGAAAATLTVTNTNDTTLTGDGLNAFIEEPLVVRDGALIVPDRPGLGVTMNLDYLRAHAAPGWGGERRA